jgi:hypothetical protein
MPEMDNLTRMTAQRYYDFFYRDGSPAYLLIHDVLRPVENIQYHTVGTTYVGGKFDVFLEGESECGQVEKHSIVYVDEHYIAPTTPDDTESTTEQTLIDAPTDNYNRNAPLPPDVGRQNTYRRCNVATRRSST